MRLDMEADNRGGSKSIQILQEAIQQLTESSNRKPFNEIETQTENRISPTANTILDENQILTNLISQLESLKEDGMMKMKKQCESSNKDSSSAEEEIASSAEEEIASSAEEEIAKEVREVQRQNKVTHWLLSGLIAVTLIWQISEGLVVMKLRNGVKHPFRSLCTWIGGRLKPPGPATSTPLNNNGQDADKQLSLSSSSLKETLAESAYLPLKFTNEIYNKDFELPQIQLPSLVSANDD